MHVTGRVMHLRQVHHPREVYTCCPPSQQCNKPTATHAHPWGLGLLKEAAPNQVSAQHISSTLRSCSQQHTLSLLQCAAHLKIMLMHPPSTIAVTEYPLTLHCPCRGLHYQHETTTLQLCSLGPSIYPTHLGRQLIHPLPTASPPFWQR
jgi:hypothetical protein